MYNVLLSSLRNVLEGLVQRKSLSKEPGWIKEKRPIGHCSYQAIRICTPIYFYARDTYKGNNLPDQTNQNGERISLFILAIKIPTKCLKSRTFVSVIQTLFKVLCRTLRVKQASISYLSIPRVRPLNSIESIEFNGVVKMTVIYQ